MSTTSPSQADPADRPELTWPALVVGAILGILFGASSLYLVLRVGMTVSASIPVAVLSITLFRAFSNLFGVRRATILENNIVQTTGSAGESIAFGVGVTMPALMILGYEMELPRVMLVASLGGLLGILMMIPLRRAFIVQQHETLKYPEGTACAKVLIVGEQGGASARTVFVGFGLAAVYQVLMQALRLWAEVPGRLIRGFQGARVAAEVSPALLGVGYIIGPRIASVMVAGGILSALVLTPTIAFFGGGLDSPLPPARGHIIREMAPTDIQKEYVLYIGAGAVATGGVISLLQVLPLIVSSVRGGLRDLRGGLGTDRPRVSRTERDLPLWFVGLGATALVALISATPLIPTAPVGRLAGAVLIVLFGFLFVTVSSRLTGEIGSSSNPISGMTVATLLLTCLVFVLLGWVGPEYRLAALSIAAIVCIAASNGGTTSQDLKTGYLIGGTPRAQQLAILVGALTSAIVIGFTLQLLNQAGTVVTSRSEYLLARTVDPAILTETETYDGKTWKVWRVQESGQSRKYLIDEQGRTRYYVDPAINGRLNTRDDGTRVTKYDAPKAALMAIIIDGIMGTERSMPWNLVLLGVFLAIVLQLAGVPALPFAVGVYLPLSASVPIFLGGLARGFVDWHKKTPPEESDTSPAVLLSSGYIAGGTITAILVTVGLLAWPSIAPVLDLSARLPAGWEESPWPALGAFGVLTAVLVLVGTGHLLRDVEPPEIEEGLTARDEAV